jgi:hypothetical protein
MWQIVKYLKSFISGKTGKECCESLPTEQSWGEHDDLYSTWTRRTGMWLLLTLSVRQIFFLMIFTIFIITKGKVFG